MVLRSVLLLLRWWRRRPGPTQQPLVDMPCCALTCRLRPACTLPAVCVCVCVQVCRDITRDVESCSDATSYEVGMSCTKKCFDPSKIMAIAHGEVAC